MNANDLDFRSHFFSFAAKSRIDAFLSFLLYAFGLEFKPKLKGKILISMFPFVHAILIAP